MKIKSLVSRFLLIGALGGLLAGCPTDETIIEQGTVTMSSMKATNKYGTNVTQNIVAGAKATSLTDIQVTGSDVKGKVTFNNLSIVLASGTARQDTYKIEKLEIRFDTTDSHTYDTTINESCLDGSSSKACKEFKSSSIWNDLSKVSAVDNGNGTVTIVTKTPVLPKYGDVPTEYTVTFTYNYVPTTPPPPSCRADQVVVDNACACPSGQLEIGGVCQVPVSCRADQVVVNNTCACPSGQLEISGSCQLPVSCRADQVVVNNTCACPSGKTEIGGVCQVPVSCRADQVVVNNTCACPSGQLEIGGVCQVPVSCRADQVVVNNTCECPAGKVETNGQCQDPAPVMTQYSLTHANFYNMAIGYIAPYSYYSATMTLNETTKDFTGEVYVSYSEQPAPYDYGGLWTTVLDSNSVNKPFESCENLGQIDVCRTYKGNWVGSEALPVTVVKSGDQITITRNSNNGYFDQVDVYIFTKTSAVISCPEGQVQIGSACQVPAACPEGLVYDDAQGCVVPPPSCRADQVVVNNACACPSGESEIGGVCQVPVSCRVDQVVVDNSCTCPSGQAEINNICQVPVQCRVDQVATPQNTCACPSGKTEIGGVCQVPASCRVDQIVVNNGCVCPSGQAEINGVCQVPVQCRADQVATPLNTCACPAGQSEVNGVCQVPAPVTVNYNFTSGTYSNTFGSGNYNISMPNGPLTKAADGTITGKVTVQYVSGTAGFNYAGTWSFKAGVTTLTKSGETCTNTGSQNACGTMVGNWTSNLTVVESGTTTTVQYKTTSFPAQTNIYKFVKQ